MRAPLLLAYVSFCAGIFAAGFVRVSLIVILPAAGAAALALKCPRFAPAISAQLLFLALLGQQHLQQQNERYVGMPLVSFVGAHELETFRVRGTVLQTPEIADDYTVLRLRVLAIADRAVAGVARITISGTGAEAPVAGDEIEAFVRFRLPRNFGTEGSFDYERYLRKEGVHVLGTIKSERLLHVVRKGSSLRSGFSRLRLALIRRIMRNYAPADAAVLRALWLDDRAGLSPETERTLIDAGVFHVIAISGFHVAVVLGLGFLVLRRLVRYRVALLVLSVLLLFYFFLLEGRPAISRSFLLFLAFSFAALRNEQMKWGNALGFCAFLQAAWNPLNLFDAGYHLTYLSTAAIVFVAAPITRRVRLRRAVYRYLFEFALVSLCVQFVLAPYQAWTFHRVPIAATLANWVAIPASSVLIALGTLTLPLAPLDSLLSPIVCLFLRALMKSASISSGIWLVTAIAPPFPAVILFYTSLSAFLVVRMRWLRAVVALLLIVSFVALWITPGESRSSLRIHMLDVGQGDAILLEYPGGRFDLVDGGGFWNTDALDVGESVLLPYFSRIGVRRIQRVFLTHAHADHMNGLFAVLRYIPVESLYVTRRPLATFGYQRLVREWPGEIRSLHEGDTFAEGAVRIKVMAPHDSRNQLEVANDDSLVLLLEYSRKKVLLTGDIERNAEERLSAITELSSIDVVKVPHHGSRTSSSEDLLSLLRPRSALISVGHNNWFGHPHPEILERYRRRHTMIYRSDRSGTIIVDIDSSGITIETNRM